MSPLLGPILAQLVTLGVSDRSEARHIVAATNVSGSHYSELATYPRANLNFGWKRVTLSLGYGPSITLTPLEAKDPSVLVFHSGSINVSNRRGRTTVDASESLGAGQIDLRAQGLAYPGTAPVAATPDPAAMTPNGGPANPPAPGGTTPTGTQQPGALAPNQLGVTGSSVTFWSSTSSVAVSHAVSTILSVSGGVSYLVTGSIGSEQAGAYPTTRGPGAQASATYALTHHDGVRTTVATQQSFSSNGNNAWFLSANENWSHQFDARTSSTLGAGLSISRNSQPNGLIYYSVYPTFVTGINHTSLLGRGTLALGLNVTSAPALDPLRATVDPRISAAAFVVFSKDKFSSTLSGGSAISVATGTNTGALSAVYSAFGVSYAVAKGVSVDSGVRASWQSFGGQTTIPPSAAVFLGVTFGAQVPLLRH